jgi:hypothetical protein
MLTNNQIIANIVSSLRESGVLSSVLGCEITPKDQGGGLLKVTELQKEMKSSMVRCSSFYQFRDFQAITAEASWLMVLTGAVCLLLLPQITRKLAKKRLLILL